MKISITNLTAQEGINTYPLKHAYYRAGAGIAGTGIGLWLSDQLIKMLGGQILLTSNNYKFKAVLLLPKLH